MKKLLCLLLTLLLIHPALAEDALGAPDAASLLSCADGTVLAVSPDLRFLRRDSAGDWALVLSAEQISAACPPRFMPDAANALLLPGENGAYALLLLPDASGQIAVLSLTGATCVLTRVFADFLPMNSEMTAQWALLSAARVGNTLYAAFSSNFATYSTYALSLADGSSFLLSDAPIRFLMPLADGQLLACVNPPISSIDESCFALLDADSGESSRLCALPAHKAYAGFALDVDSLYFTDGETIYCAASLLSYLLDNQPYDAKLALLPDYAVLQPNPAYTEAAQKILDDEALYMQYRATLSPLEQKQAEDILADARAALHQIPPNVYSAAEIATYHARLNHAHMLESSFWVSGDQHVSTLRQRLLDGECTVETFVQELTRIVQMMTLENGVSS